jgi:hypothetical protein
MSMNDVEQLMLQFESSLETFNTTVRESIKQIEDRHEKIDNLWQDTMRESYDEHWVPLREQLIDYDLKVGPEYVEVMVELLQFLRRYLYGY